MKTLIKLTALAIIAAFAVISCTPEAELSDVDWGAVNTKNDVGLNTGVDHTKPVISSSNLSTDTPTVDSNQVILNFDVTADVLKSSEATIEAKLKTFLSFHHFAVAVEDEPGSGLYGKADVLDQESLDYSYVKRNGQTVTVKLSKTFLTTNSPVIAKINAATYTFANGKKMDNANRGRTGEAGYDDVYTRINVTGATTTAFVAPGNRGWSLRLETIPGGSGAGSITSTDIPIATLTIGTERINNDLKEAVANQLKGGLTVEKFVNNSWTNVVAVINYEVLNNRFVLAALVRSDLEPHRVVFTGAPVITTAQYFGVNQWIKVIGDNTSTSIAAETNQHDWYLNKVYGAVSAPWYIDPVGAPRFATAAPKVSTYSYDPNDQNVVIDVEFVLTTYGEDEHNSYGLKDLNSNTQLFKDNFKIAYYNEPGYYSITVGNEVVSIPNDANNFVNRPDLVYVDIKEYEYLDTNPVTTPAYPRTRMNTIRITLDPAYKMLDDKPIFLYLGREICYDITSSHPTSYGSIGNWQYNYFKVFGDTLGNGYAIK